MKKFTLINLLGLFLSLTALAGGTSTTGSGGISAMQQDQDGGLSNYEAGSFVGTRLGQPNPKVIFLDQDQADWRFAIKKTNGKLDIQALRPEEMNTDVLQALIKSQQSRKWEGLQQQRVQSVQDFLYNNQ